MRGSDSGHALYYPDSQVTTFVEYSVPISVISFQGLTIGFVAAIFGILLFFSNKIKSIAFVTIV